MVGRVSNSQVHLPRHFSFHRNIAHLSSPLVCSKDRYWTLWVREQERSQCWSLARRCCHGSGLCTAPRSQLLWRAGEVQAGTFSGTERRCAQVPRSGTLLWLWRRTPRVSGFVDQQTSTKQSNSNYLLYFPLIRNALCPHPTQGSVGRHCAQL